MSSIEEDNICISLLIFHFLSVTKDTFIQLTFELSFDKIQPFQH